jgi:hypothetical protein
MITYKQCKGFVAVYLEKKRVGAIRLNKGGYKYFPNGKKEGGAGFDTIRECKKSLAEGKEG